MSFEVKTWWLKVIEMIRFVTVIVKKGFGKYVEKSLKMSVSKYVERRPKKRDSKYVVKSVIKIATWFCCFLSVNVELLMVWVHHV